MKTFILSFFLIGCSGSVGVNILMEATPEPIDDSGVVSVVFDGEAHDAAQPDVNVPDTGLDACVQTPVSLSQDAFCGPEKVGAVCTTQGTIYVCKEASDAGTGQPPLQGCLLVSQKQIPETGEIITRTLCPTKAWIDVPDFDHKCQGFFSRRMSGYTNIALPSNECQYVPSWEIDGVGGSTACCKGN